MFAEIPTKVPTTTNKAIHIPTRQQPPIVDVTMPHRNNRTVLPESAAVGKREGGMMRKVLLNVRVQASVGCVQVLLSLDSTVADLIMAVVLQYAKERRRPLVLPNDVALFDLHYSAFSLDCLDREEKLATLGSRNFFMCKRKEAADHAPNNSCNNGGTTSSSCSKQADKATELASPNPWLRFMSFLL